MITPKEVTSKTRSPALAAAGGGGLLIYWASLLVDYPVLSKALTYCAPAISVYGAILTKLALDRLNREIQNYSKRELLNFARKACEQAENDPLLPPETKAKLKKKYAELTEIAFDNHIEGAAHVFEKDKNRLTS